MDYLKSTIWLRGYAQRDPAVEYKIDGFQAFRNLQETIDTEYVGGIIKTKLRVVTSEDAFQNARSAMRYSQPQEATGNVNRTLDKASQMNRRDEAAYVPLIRRHARQSDFQNGSASRQASSEAGSRPISITIRCIDSAFLTRWLVSARE